MNANQEISDEVVAQALRLERYKKRTLNRLLKILKEADRDILEQINGTQITGYQAARINAMAKRIREIIRAAYIAVSDDFAEDLQDLVRSEVGAGAAILNGAVGVTWARSPSIEQAYAAAYARPYQGKLMRKHYSDLGETVSRLAIAQIRIGYLESETQQQVYNRVNRVLKKRGVNMNRTLVNTTISHFQSFAKRRLYEANAGSLKGLQLNATLDTKTSEICQERDGRVYDVKRAPHLPFHYNERSEYNPVIKSFKSLNFEVPESKRNSLDGKVAGDLNFKSWIDRQSFSRQAEAVGRSRASLLKSDSISAADLYGNSRLLKVAELRDKFPDQFAEFVD